MLTLIWQGPHGEYREIRPDSVDGSFTLVVPRSERTGLPLKLVSVFGGTSPEVVTTLMREFG